MTLAGIISYMYNALVVAIPLFALWGFLRVRNLRENKKKIIRYKEVALWCFVFYVLCLYMVTVFRADFSISRVLEQGYSREQINIIPLIELIKLWDYGYFWSFIYNVVGNILWFMPFGYLLPIIKKKVGLRSIVLRGMLVSLSIEILQFIFITGVTDIDDIIFNTLGTLMGYTLLQFVRIFL